MTSVASVLVVLYYAMYYWSGGTEEVTSRYRILMHARPRSGIGGGRGPGEILLRAYVRPSVRPSVRGHKLL